MSKLCLSRASSVKVSDPIYQNKTAAPLLGFIPEWGSESGHPLNYPRGTRTTNLMEFTNNTYGVYWFRFYGSNVLPLFFPFCPRFSFDNNSVLGSDCILTFLRILHSFIKKKNGGVNRVWRTDFLFVFINFVSSFVFMKINLHFSYELWNVGINNPHWKGQLDQISSKAVYWWAIRVLIKRKQNA